MAKRSTNTTKDYLLSATLPHFEGHSYTIISHGFIIDHTIAELTAKGFEIEKELYRATKSGNIGQGIYHLNYGSDPEMKMMFAWGNSYDKTMKFKCAIGGYIPSNNNSIIGNMGSWVRKHMGTADTDTIDTIHNQIADAEKYYSQLVADKALMKNIILTKKQKAEFIGRLYLEFNIITSEQLAVIKSEFKTPSFEYNADKDSLWTMYNSIVYSLQRAHPKQWMDQQRMIHFLINDNIINLPSGTSPYSSEVILVPIDKNPAQIDLIESIAEVEKELTKVELQIGGGEEFARTGYVHTVGTEVPESILTTSESPDKIIQPGFVVEGILPTNLPLEPTSDFNL